MVKSEKQRSRRAEEQEAAAAAAAATVVEEEDGDNNYELYDDWDYFSEEETQEAVAVEEDGAEAEEKEEEASALEELGEDARLVLEAFRSELEAPLEGLGQLDGLLGDGHGLLAGSSGGGVGGGAAAAMGRQYGLADGVWRHSGWRAMAGVQVRMRYASPTLFYVHPTTLPTHRPEVDLFFSYHNLRFRFAFASLAPLLTAGEAPGHGRAAGLVASLGRRPALRGKRRRLPPTVRVPDSMREVPRIAVAAPDRPGASRGSPLGGTSRG